MAIYFDNAATTKPFDEVVGLMSDCYMACYGNPSSLHRLGFEAEKKVKEAKNDLAKILGVMPKEILFTSGGTESNNLAIIGVCRALQRRGKHIITSAIEHPSVLRAFEYLEENEGYDLTILPVDAEGIVDLVTLKEAVREDTILVSVMHVNNEIGVVEPLYEIGEVVKGINKNTVFHVDAIQSFCKQKIEIKKCKIDMLSVSGHKIHGPKGVGFLYIRSGINIKPLVFGGAQQNGLRSGTENVPGILGMALAAKKMTENSENNKKYIQSLKDRFIGSLLEHIEEITINGNKDETVYNIVNVSFSDIKSEVLLHSLEAANIYVSSGSACSSHKPGKSHVLKAIGVDDHLIDGSLRFSFSIFNTEDEIDQCIIELKKTVPMLRRFVKK